jgi:hypothetical protein
MRVFKRWTATKPQGINMDARFKDLEDSPQFDKSVRGTTMKIGRSDETVPFDALYISQELAILHLLDSIHTNVGPSTKWYWVKTPIIEKFQMTECPISSMVHRVVQNRYAGYCEIEVEL